MFPGITKPARQQKPQFRDAFSQFSFPATMWWRAPSPLLPDTGKVIRPHYGLEFNLLQIALPLEYHKKQLSLFPHPPPLNLLLWAAEAARETHTHPQTT